MAYYFAKEMETVLAAYPQFIDQLYGRGFLITDEQQTDLTGYPYYGRWKEKAISDHQTIIYFYWHKDTDCFFYNQNETTFFLVGHAYNPFKMLLREEDILKDLANAAETGTAAYWDAESELTGVFCTGYIKNGKLVYSTDCCGMQLVNHGLVENRIFITSHSKLAADLKNLKQTEYIRRLVAGRYWHYWGNWLPGDLSPFSELKRLQPNCAGEYDGRQGTLTVSRYYPLHEVREVQTEEEFQEIIEKLSVIMTNTMKLIGQKWPGKKTSVSVTGGRDSMTALSCCNGIYDQFHYFSYISNYDESVDAYAASDILKALGLEHEIYEIPSEWSDPEELDAFKKIMECNAGCIGPNNENDVRKRLYFSKHPPCDVEVKSWVNEMGRGWYWNKYNKNTFPEYPNASYWRSMHKLYATPYLIRETDKVFREYLSSYYSKEVFDRLNWLELYFWEFAWGGGEGIFLTSEHRMTYEITIPFNNRKYVELMLTVPLEKRKNEGIPNAMITRNEPRITETGIVIKDVSHTNMRALMVRLYLEIFSKIRIPG